MLVSNLVTKLLTEDYICKYKCDYNTVVYRTIFKEDL